MIIFIKPRSITLEAKLFTDHIKFEQEKKKQL